MSVLLHVAREDRIRPSLVIYVEHIDRALDFATVGSPFVCWHALLRCLQNAGLGLPSHCGLGHLASLLGKEVPQFHADPVFEELCIVKATIIAARSIFWIEEWQELRVAGEVLHLLEECQLLRNRLGNVHIDLLVPKFQEVAFAVP